VKDKIEMLQPQAVLALAHAGAWIREAPVRLGSMQQVKQAFGRGLVLAVLTRGRQVHKVWWTAPEDPLLGRRASEAVDVPEPLVEVALGALECA